MGEIKSFQDLNEKSLEIILNFKTQDKFGKSVTDEILKLKSNVKKAISLLPENEQKVLELRYYQNISLDEIAKKLSVSRETISETLLSGIKNIKEKIKDGITDKLAIPSTNFYWWGGFISMLIVILILTGLFSMFHKTLSSKVPEISFFINKLTDFAVGSIDEIKLLVSKGKKSTSIIEDNNIKISGSTSLLALSRRWENAFSIEHPMYKVRILSSDSDRGINDLIKGEIDIANSSRPLTYPDEQRALSFGKQLVEQRVAIDALVIIVNKNNPLEELALDDLKFLFSGEVNNWSSINGINKPVVAVVREKGSGTNDFAINRILEGNDFIKNIVRKNSNEEIFNIVSHNEGAISFLNSINYPWDYQNIKYIKVKSYPNSVSVSPFLNQKLNENAMRYGDYPLAHYLYLIALDEQKKSVKDFIEWILSKKGQEVVSYSGLVPVLETN